MNKSKERGPFTVDPGIDRSTAQFLLATRSIGSWIRVQLTFGIHHLFKILLHNRIPDTYTLIEDARDFLLPTSLSIEHVDCNMNAVRSNQYDAAESLRQILSVVLQP